MQISKHFKKSEFACKCGCGIEFEVDAKLLKALDSAREICGPLVISSGVRCNKHNKEVGGAPNSFHKLRDGVLLGADVTIASKAKRNTLAVLRLYTVLDKGNARGLGLYNNWCHVDFRPLARQRWSKLDWDI